MKSPFFSVIIPVYNVQKFLSRCVESVLEQDFLDYEIILVDDGSNDGSSHLCDYWAEKDIRIHVIHKENEGLGMARNSGIEVAKGEYIFFFDSDDFVRQGLLNACKSRIDETGCDVVFFGMSRLDENGNSFLTLVPNPTDLVWENPQRIKNELLPDFITKNPHTGQSSNVRVSVCCSCIRRELILSQNLRFVSERQYISEDLFFFVELFDHLNKVAFLTNWYYCYCQNRGSLTFSYKKDRFERLEMFYKDIDVLARRYEYSEEVLLRLKGSYIASTLGCLKMEAANTSEVGFISAYQRIKTICTNPSLCDAVRQYPSEHLKRSWKITKWFILRKHFLLLYVCVYIQYIRRGI